MNLGTTRPKLIATDLDGTIVHHDGTITPRTLAAFQRARDLGVEIWFVTGRPPRWMGEIKDAFGYGNFFTATALLGLPVLVLVWLASRVQPRMKAPQP